MLLRLRGNFEQPLGSFLSVKVTSSLPRTQFPCLQRKKPSSMILVRGLSRKGGVQQIQPLEGEGRL